MTQKKEIQQLLDKYASKANRLTTSTNFGSSIYIHLYFEKMFN
jgi:hypothetical protein